MANVFIWDGKEIHPTDNRIHEYAVSLRNALANLRIAMEQQDYPVISVYEAMDFLSDTQDNNDWALLVGTSFISMVTTAEEWHSPGKVLAEEFFGPRAASAKVDLDEYIAGMKAMAVYCGCTEFLLGTLANPRKDAMARALTSRGMTVKTITLRYKV